MRGEPRPAEALTATPELERMMRRPHRARVSLWTAARGCPGYARCASAGAPAHRAHRARARARAPFEDPNIGERRRAHARGAGESAPAAAKLCGAFEVTATRTERDARRARANGEESAWCAGELVDGRAPLPWLCPMRVRWRARPQGSPRPCSSASSFRRTKTLEIEEEPPREASARARPRPRNRVEH